MGKQNKKSMKKQHESKNFFVNLPTFNSTYREDQYYVLEETILL